LRYRLAGGSAVDWFNMDEVTGIIRVARGGDLEWEQDSALHTLSVVAVDQGKPWPQTTTTTLTVQVTSGISFSTESSSELSLLLRNLTGNLL